MAGPLTKGNLFENVHSAAKMGDALWKAGYLPFVPHIISLGEVVIPRGYEDAMEFDFLWLSRCDILIRLPGESPGADREVDLAHELNIPVYTSLEALINAERL